MSSKLYPRIATWLIPAQLLLVAGTALATTTYVTATVDGNYIYATAVTDTNYVMGGNHIAYATAKIVAPDGRSSEMTAFQSDSVTVSTMIAIDDDDGTYTSYNYYPQEYYLIGMVYNADETAQTTTNVQKFVQIVRTGLSKSAINKTNDSSVYTVYVRTSTKFSGDMEVGVGLTKAPGTILATIRALPGGTANDSFASQRKSMSSHAIAEFQYEVATTFNNQYAGSITASGEFDVTPACENRRPDSGSGYSKTQTITVKDN